MDQKTLVDQWVELETQISQLKRLQDAIVSALPKSPSGTELEGHTARVRVRDRAVLRPELLEAKLSATLWRRITKRVPVADLYRAEVKRGKLTQELLDQCSIRSKSWLEIVNG